MKIDIEKIKSEKTIQQLLDFSIINIDKPSRPTSFATSHFVKKKLKAKKSSHFGTLDPMVTGVLPTALNKACRLNEYLMHKNKTYVGIMRLHKEVTEENLKKVISESIGNRTQLPPVRSRVKRAERVREIKSFKILEEKGKDILFETEVQAGTYIRKLIHDIGEKVGGAHMLELRRTKAGPFDESTLVNLYQFEDAVIQYKKGDEDLLRKILIPGEMVAEFIPSVQIKKEFEEKCLNGSPIFNKFLVEEKNTLEKDEKVCAFIGKKLIGIYSVKKEKEIFAMPEVVLV